MKRAVAAVAVLLVAACIDLSTDPHEIVAIEFRPLPWPSVVAGDSLRDASGAAVPLGARLFDASGAEVSGQALDFLSRDTTVTITDGNFLIAHSTATTGTARLLASGAGLQSGVRLVELVPRPDSLATQGTIDTLRVGIIDSPTHVSGGIGVKVLSLDDVGGASAVRSWIVSFSLSFRGATVAAGDTSAVYLVDDAGRASSIDTTDAQGTASRRVRFKTSTALPTAIAITQLDSVIVTATASYRGAPLARSPLRLVLPVKPK